LQARLEQAIEAILNVYMQIFACFSPYEAVNIFNICIKQNFPFVNPILNRTFAHPKKRT